MALNFESKYSENIVTKADIDAMAPKAVEAMNTLMNKTGEGNDFLGWVDLPTNYDKEEFARIKESAEYIKNNCDVLIVIGIGGSYLGARAVIEALKSSNYNLLKKDTPQIYFIGNSISPASLNEIVSLCEGKDICVNVISKSGTTTEPAIAFRVFRELVNKKYSKEEAAKRIFCKQLRQRELLRVLQTKRDMQHLSYRMMSAADIPFSQQLAFCRLPLPELILISLCSVQEMHKTSFAVKILKKTPVLNMRQ